MEKTQRDIRRLNLRIRNFTQFSDYELVEEYVKVIVSFDSIGIRLGNVAMLQLFSRRTYEV